MKNLLGLIFLIIYLPPVANAGGMDYRCTIEGLSIASVDAVSSYATLSKIYIGKKFTVERKSGVMAGILKNSYVTNPQVIDAGSSDNSYKVVSTMKVSEGAGAGSNIYALNIAEFEPVEKKPFVFLQNNQVFFGYCEHF